MGDTFEGRITIRLTAADHRRLRRVSGPVARSLVAREALRIGLSFFERHPHDVMKITPTPPGPKPKKSRRD